MNLDDMYNVGDQVTIKSESWYRENKPAHADLVMQGVHFPRGMMQHLGRTYIILDKSKIDSSDTFYRYRLGKPEDLGWTFVADLFEEPWHYNKPREF